MTGDAVFYIGYDNKIRAIKYSNATQTWSNSDIYSQTSLTVSPRSFIDVIDINSVFFVNNHNFISHYWNNGKDDGFAPLPFKAAPWTNIVNRNSNEVFFINDNRKLTRLRKEGSLWKGKKVECDLIKENSKIQTTNAVGRVFFVRDIDSRVCSYWWNDSAEGVEVLDIKSTSVMNGSDIQVSENGDNVFYIGTDGNFHVLFYDGCKWIDVLLNDNCKANIDYGSFTIFNAGSVTYFDGQAFRNLFEPTINQDFVYKKSTLLYMNGSPYRAVIADYCPTIYRRNGRLFLGPHPHYDGNYNVKICTSEQDCEIFLNSHFENIYNAGFNAIRFNDLTLTCDTNNFHSPNTSATLYINLYDIDSTGVGWEYKRVDVSDIQQELFECFAKIIDIAGDHNLKVNFFTGLQEGQYIHNLVSHENYGNYLSSFATFFKDNPNILMYSIMLEPDFSKEVTHVLLDKAQVCQTINEWYDIIREVDKNHLVSVGLMDHYSIGNFDPGIMNVDVITWHIYPDMSQKYPDYDFEYFFQKLYWVSNIMRYSILKPWIVGETGIPSVNNPSHYEGDPLLFNLVVTYSDQRAFGTTSLQNIFSVGASGYGWWQYRDVFDKNPKDLGVYFGLVNHDGDNKEILSPSVFKNIPKCNCHLIDYPEDYFNHNNTYINSINGYIRDNSGPVRDALIFVNGWDCGGKFYYTYSSGSGYFRLKTDCNLSTHALNIVAPGKRNLIVNNAVDWLTYHMSDAHCSEDIKNSNFVTSIIDNSLKVTKSFKVYPNPTSAAFTINLDGKSVVNIIITNVIGNEILKIEKIKDQQFLIDLGKYPDGVYFVTVESIDDKRTEKIVKSKSFF